MILLMQPEKQHFLSCWSCQHDFCVISLLWSEVDWAVSSTSCLCLSSRLKQTPNMEKKPQKLDYGEVKSVVRIQSWNRCWTFWTGENMTLSSFWLSAYIVDVWGKCLVVRLHNYPAGFLLLWPFTADWYLLLISGRWAVTIRCFVSSPLYSCLLPLCSQASVALHLATPTTVNLGNNWQVW